MKVVSTMSTESDHLDVSEIKRRGIEIGLTPHILSSSAVAEIAVMLLLSTARRAYENRLKLERYLRKRHTSKINIQSYKLTVIYPEEHCKNHSSGF